MKIQISINDELLARVDKCATANYMSRSGFITEACLQLILQREYFSFEQQNMRPCANVCHCFDCPHVSE